MKRSLEVAGSNPDQDTTVSTAESTERVTVTDCLERSRYRIEYDTSCVLELWLHWLSEYISIDEHTGDVCGYLEEIMPGWILLQVSRSLAPMQGDSWVCKYTKKRRWTSVAFIHKLRRLGRAGYLVDELSWERWMSVMNYTSEHFKPFLYPIGDELTDELKKKVEGATFQLMNLHHIQPGVTSTMRWWVPLDLNKLCYFL